MMLTLMLLEKLMLFLSCQTMSSLVIGIIIFNYKMMYNCHVSDNKRMLADSELEDMKTRILARGPTAVRRVKELTSRRPSWSLRTSLLTVSRELEVKGRTLLPTNSLNSVPARIRSVKGRTLLLPTSSWSLRTYLTTGSDQ